MKKILQIVIVYFVVFGLILTFAIVGNRSVTAFSEQFLSKNRTCVVIDAGHGGIDGGATSFTGVLESQVNLEIALKLADLLHFLGLHTVMIRTDDRSVYTEGKSIAAQKVSDLKERVRIVENQKNAVLISIHQNTFTDSRYSGAQVFYGAGKGSSALANAMQSNFVTILNPDSNRKSKTGKGIYLLENIHCTGVLIECGFLSNPKEEVKLRNDSYQKQICCVIGATLSTFLSNT